MLAIMLRWLGPDSPLSIDTGVAFVCAPLLLVCARVLVLVLGSTAKDGFEFFGFEHAATLRHS